MIKEHSFGIIPLRQNQGVWEVFLVQHQKGHWACPKGHPEKNETGLETAKRELFEETGLSVTRLISQIPIVEQYQFTKEGVVVDKTCTYYIAEVSGKEKLQKKEVKNGLWLTLEKAKAVVTFQEGQTVLEKVSKVIDK